MTISDSLSDVLFIGPQRPPKAGKHFSTLFEYVFEFVYDGFTTTNLGSYRSQRIQNSTKAKIRNVALLQNLYTLDQARQYLGVSRTTFYRIRKDGEISVVLLGTMPRITESALAKFVAQQETRSREQEVGF